MTLIKIYRTKLFKIKRLSDLHLYTFKGQNSSPEAWLIQHELVWNQHVQNFWKPSPSGTKNATKSSWTPCSRTSITKRESLQRELQKGYMDEAVRSSLGCRMLQTSLGTHKPNVGEVWWSCWANTSPSQRLSMTRSMNWARISVEMMYKWSVMPVQHSSTMFNDSTTWLIIPCHTIECISFKRATTSYLVLHNTASKHRYLTVGLERLEIGLFLQHHRTDNLNVNNNNHAANNPDLPLGTSISWNTEVFFIHVWIKWCEAIGTYWVQQAIISNTAANQTNQNVNAE